MVLPSLLSLSTVSILALLVSRLSVACTGTGHSVNATFTSSPSSSSPLAFLLFCMLAQPIRPHVASRTTTHFERIQCSFPWTLTIAAQANHSPPREAGKLRRDHENRVKFSSRQRYFDGEFPAFVRFRAD